MEHHSILFALFAAFTGAKLAAELFERLGQPAVVGELLVGIVLGPSLLGWVDPHGGGGETLLLLAELGVIVLLFQAGLETQPAELRKVGGAALGVGTLGVVLPFAGGLAVGLATGKGGTEAAFIATALVATSVGVTARVLSDLGKLQERESRIILGAAIIDDILGLMILTIVVGLAAGSLSTGGTVLLVIEALVFVGFLILLGPKLITRVQHFFEVPKAPQSPFLISIAILLGVSVAAEEVGLAAIVGAFLAGTIISGLPEHYEIESQMRPVGDLLAPFFFVVTGAQIEIEVFGDLNVLGLAAAITVVAIIGKLAGGWFGARGTDRAGRAIIGVGMVPRGEVGIIVASLALRAGAVGKTVFGAVLLMVVITTLLAPPVLQMLYKRRADPTDLIAHPEPGG